MGPAPGIHVLFLNFLVHFHVFSIVEHEEKDDCMHLINKEVRAVMIDFDDAGHDTLVLGLVELYLRNLVQKKLNVFPSRAVNLFSEGKSKIADIFLNT